MAVEIRELVIKAVITKDKKADKNQDAGSMSNEKIIQECVNQVMKIIKKNQKR